MSRLKLLAFLVSIVLFTFGAAAYDGGGGSSPASQCTDGVDHDDDGNIDGTGAEIDGKSYPPDPACTKPYYLDDSEFSIYDFDATWVFSELSGYDKSDKEVIRDAILEGPGVFYGWKLVHEQGEDPDEEMPDVYDEDYNEFTKQYLEDASETRGGGFWENVTVHLERDRYEDWVVVERPNGFEAVSTPPHPQADDTENRCGDGLRTSHNEDRQSLGDDPGDELDCPEDYGLPANEYEDGTSNEPHLESSNTITDAFEQEEGDLTYGEDMERSDPLEYGFDLVAWPIDYGLLGGQELERTNTNTYTDDIRDCDDENACGRTYDWSQIGNWTDDLDFYKENHEQISVVYPVSSDYQTIGSVENKYIDEHDTVNDWDPGSTRSFDTGGCTGDQQYHDCEQNVGVGTDMVCDQTGSEDGASVTEYEEEDDKTDTPMVDTFNYMRNEEPADDTGYVENDGSAQVEIVEVDYTDIESDTIEYTACTGEEMEEIDLYSCEPNDDEYDELVEEGETVSITDTVENEGDETETHDAELVIGGEVRDTDENIELDPGETKEVTLSWSTSQGDEGDYDAGINWDSYTSDNYDVGVYSEDDCEEVSEDYYNSYEEIEYASDYSSQTVEYRYQSIERQEEQVLHLNPAGNNNDPVGVRTALFYNDQFKGDAYTGESDSGSSAGGTIPYNRGSGRTYFSYETRFHDNRHQANSYGVSRSAFEIDIEGEDFISTRVERDVFNADGPYGHGDGFVAIAHVVDNINTPQESKTDEWEIVGSTPGFASEEASTAGSFVSENLVESLLEDKNGFGGCPGDYPECVASVDIYLEDIDQWGDPGDASTGVAIDLSQGSPHHVSESLGVAMMCEEIGDCNPITHYIEEDDEVYGPPSSRSDDCDPNEVGNWKAFMTGPAVNEDLEREYPAAYEGCIEDYDSCVLHGEERPEGYVANVASDNDDVQYEAGGNSPDWEVCLNIQDTGQGEDNDPGGEWYDLDGEVAHYYLHEDYDLGDIVDDYDFLTEDHADNEGYSLLEEGDESNEGDITYYWRENPNPYHEEYNPRGGEEGLTLKNNCGNPVFDNLMCSDAGEEHSRLNPAGFTYSFFEEGKRDDDYHPQGEDVPVNDYLFDGYIVKLKDKSDQLEPGMATDSYSMSDSDSELTVEKWYSTIGDETHSNQWGIAPGESSLDLPRSYRWDESEIPSGDAWSIDGTGTPYPPWGTYYRSPGDRRTDEESSSRSKVQKAFGNSYAAVAGPGLDGELDYNDNVIREGEGVWIDPDSIRDAWETSQGDNPDYIWPDSVNDWTELLHFNMDITGPDSGLGFDDPDREEPLHNPAPDQDNVVVADIVWEKEDGTGTSNPESGNIHQNLEPNMCGDDRHEFLIEEIGEAPNSEQGTGPYACTPNRDRCFTSDGNRFVDRGAYMQTNEPGEDEGRFKNDEEYCGENPSGLGVWYDQDFKQEACRENTLYGDEGKRWIDRDYVRDNPYAVAGGIDDSWSSYKAQKIYEYEEYKRFESDPDGENWDDGDDLDSHPDSGIDGYTPVSTGTDHEYTASLGFCGGDDAGEELVVQRSNTHLVDTDTEVLGVAVARDKASCILNHDDYNVDVDSHLESEKVLYNPGESVQFDDFGREIACFDGIWYDSWPVSFHDDTMSVVWNETATQSFSIINIHDETRTFEVEMEGRTGVDDSIARTAEFIEGGGQSFTTTVEPQSSRQFSISVLGLDPEINAGDDRGKVRVIATATDADIQGEDSIDVNVLKEGERGDAETREPRNIPGIKGVQVLAMILLSLVVVYRQS